jgi:hypothetical protein
VGILLAADFLLRALAAEDRFEVDGVHAGGGEFFEEGRAGKGRIGRLVRGQLVGVDRRLGRHGHDHQGDAERLQRLVVGDDRGSGIAARGGLGTGPEFAGADVLQLRGEEEPAGRLANDHPAALRRRFGGELGCDLGQGGAVGPSGGRGGEQQHRAQKRAHESTGINGQRHQWGAVWSEPGWAGFEAGQHRDTRV